MNAPPGESGHAHSVGSVAEEAARIIGLFSAGMDPDAVQAAGARAAGTPRPAPVACPTCGHEPRADGGDSVCRICPVCRVLTIVRSINPETLERVADVVELLSDGLRSYASNRRDAAAREAALRETRAAEAAAAAGVRDVTAEFFPEAEDFPIADEDARSEGFAPVPTEEFAPMSDSSAVSDPDSQTVEDVAAAGGVPHEGSPPRGHAGGLPEPGPGCTCGHDATT